jgi:Transglycosylase SLT domain
VRTLLLPVVACITLSAAAQAAEDRDNLNVIRGCIDAAAAVHRLPPAVLVTLLNVERGLLGQVSPNTNRTVDIGPMQVNQIHIAAVAAHWGTSAERTYRALRDSFCANVEAGAWILRRSLDKAKGDFWEGVGYYHSHTPEYQRAYLQSVLRQVMHLQELVRRPDPPKAPGPRDAALPSAAAAGN